MDITLLSTLITYLVFGWLGYAWAINRSLPAKFVDWILWLIAFLLAGSIRADLVNIFGFTIRTQDILQGLALGVLVNFVFRLIRSKGPQEKKKQ